MQDVIKTCLKDIFQNVFKTSSRHLQNFFQNVFKIYLQERHLLQGLFKRSSGRRLANSSWNRSEDFLEDKKMLHWKRLRHVFNTSSPRRMFAGISSSCYYRLKKHSKSEGVHAWLRLLFCNTIRVFQGMDGYNWCGRRDGGMKGRQQVLVQRNIIT